MQVNHPKLSIITVNLNNASGLEETIQSVVDQTYNNYEYIVIDGNSSDNSVNIIQKYQSKIDYWVSEPDKGIYNAMNKGILKAKGEYVIFLNSADRFVNKETLMNVFSKNHTADFIIGNIIRVWKRYTERSSIASKLTFYNIIAHKEIPHQATFTKRYLFDEIGPYDEKFKICADRLFLYLALFKYNKTIEKIDIDISVMDTNGISSSRIGFQKIIKEEQEIFRTYFPYLHEDYKEFYRLRRFTYPRVKKYLMWQIKKRLR